MSWIIVQKTLERIARPDELSVLANDQEVIKSTWLSSRAISISLWAGCVKFIS